MAVDNELDKYFAEDAGGEVQRPESPDQLSRYFEEPVEVEQPVQQSSGIDKYFKEEAKEEPSRLGAVARTIAQEFVPATAAGITVSALSKLPIPAVPKFMLGATGAVLSAGVAGRVQEAAAKGIIGEEAVRKFQEQRRRDIEAYPASTFAASVLTPTAGALTGLGKGGISAIRGLAGKAPQAAEAAVPRATEEAAIAQVRQELPFGTTGKTVSEINAERAKLLPTPGAGQGIRRTAERMILAPETPEELARKFADSRNRALYNKASPKSIAKDIRGMTPEARGAIAQSDDLVGTVAKFVSLEDSRKAGDIQTADTIFDTVYSKLTNAAQLLSVGKLIETTPEGYSYIVKKTLEKSARKFATKQEQELLDQGKLFTPQMQEELIDLFKKNKLAQEAYDSAKTAARTDFSKAAKKFAVDKENEALAASFNLSVFEADLLAKELGDQIPDFIRGNLLTTISQGANILGNTVNMPTRAATRQVASLLDQIERNIVRPVAERIPVVGKKFSEKFLAKEKQFMSPLGRGSLERFIEVGKAGGRGLAEGIGGLKRGVSAESVLAGEGVRGFRPLRAAKQLFTGKGLAEPIAGGIEGASAKTMDRIRLLSESTLGIPPETMFRLLQLGDTPARRMAQARLLTEARQLEGLSGEALRRAVRFPTQAEADKVASEVAEAVYQQDSALARGLSYILNLAPKKLEQIPGIGKPMAGGARTAIAGFLPYTKTPSNVIDELLEYSIPEYSFIKGLKNQATGNYRRAKLQFAKSIIGYSIRNVADMISNAGLITEAPSKSEKVRDVQYQAEPPRMINLTGMQRWIDSGFEKQDMQPGDYLVGLEKLGVVGGIMSTSNAARKASQSGNGSIGEAWGATLPETLKFAFNQSFLKSMNSLLGAISRGEVNDIDGWLANYYGALASAVIPNQVSAFSRYLNESMPDKIRAEDIEGSTLAEKTFNTLRESFMRKIPSEAASLPSRINVWGQKIQNVPEGADPFIYNFIDPTKGRRITYDNIALAAYDLYKKTNQTEALPPVADRSIVVTNSRTGKRTKYRLDPYLYEKYAKSYGRANRSVAEELLSNRNFRKLEPEEQVKRLSSAYRKAGESTRLQFISKNQRRIEMGQEQ